MPANPKVDQNRDDTAEFHKQYTKDKNGVYLRNEMPKSERLTPERLAESIRSLLQGSVVVETQQKS